MQVYCLFVFSFCRCRYTVCSFILALVSLISCSKIVTWLIKNLIFLGEISSGFKKTNLVSMTRAATENNRNVSSKTVATTFENILGLLRTQVKRFGKTSASFDARKSDYLMEKANFPENILIYLNQSYLTIKKNKKDILL